MELVKKGTSIETEEIITYDKELTAPITEGTVVGKVQINDKSTGKMISQTELYVQNNIEKSTVLDYFKKIFELFILKEMEE